MTEIRPLHPADADAYLALRREMLADSPWAFGSSLSDDRMSDPARVLEQIQGPERAIIGAFLPDDDHSEPRAVLVGATGIYRQTQEKARHRASVWGVYVRPTARGRGLALQMLLAALDRARDWPGVDSVGLSVSVASPAARRVYERAGFLPWGVEPAALMIDGRAFDEVHMVARLREGL